MTKTSIPCLLFVAVATTAVAGSHPSFSNPPEVSSANGVLSTTLTVQPAALKVAGKNVTFPALFNGLYTPPVLHLDPGDTLELLLNNFVRLPTNLHYHGFNVTPQEPGDDIYVSIDQGASYQYDFTLPGDHPQGLFWYHPHRDPFLNTQIAGGMAGGMIVGDILAPFPALQGIPEQLLLLKDLKIENGAPELDPDPTGATRRTINGLYKPTLELPAGQLQFWRFGNQSSNIFYDITLEGQTFYVIAVDGNLQNQAIATDELLLPPGGRLEVLVYGPSKPGKYKLRTKKFDTGPTGDHYPAQVLMTVRSKGPAVAPIPIPTAFPMVPDLRQGPIANQRMITFSDTADPNLFTVNGKPFSMGCVDTVVTLGDVEEWTIQNTAQEAHVFHIHQIDFQVVSVNGQAKPFTGYQDVVTLPPAASDGTPSVVTVRLPFTNPVIVGKFVYHCHIIQHEDQGMMAAIQVVDPAAPPPNITRCQDQTSSGGVVHHH